MANFSDIPPEIKVLIYHALLADPLRDGDRIMFTMNQDSQPNWDRTTELHPPEDELVTDVKPAPVKSSIKHLDYSNLWSLATTSKLLYTEAKPIIYANACLEYTFGDSFGAYESPTLLHTFLEKLPLASCALLHHLTIINNRTTAGKALTARDMKTIVDLLNDRLPNLVSLDIRAIDPMTEPWVDETPPEFVRDHLQIMAAARPVALLASGPRVTLKPRVCFYLEPEKGTFDPDITLVLRLLRGLMVQHVMPTLIDITKWRRQARQHHEVFCQQGTYLETTSIMRSDAGGATEPATVSDMETALADREQVMKQIEDCKHWRVLFDRVSREGRA
ncbi:hypothetical protein KCU95_g12159, partial [Aureobasidium melanogenum]